MHHAEAIEGTRCCPFHAFSCWYSSFLPTLLVLPPNVRRECLHRRRDGLQRSGNQATPIPNPHIQLKYSHTIAETFPHTQLVCNREKGKKWPNLLPNPHVHIQVQHNQLEALPAALFSLPGLEALDCHDNKLSGLPRLAACGRLTELVLAENRLAVLEDDVFDGATALETLDLVCVPVCLVDALSWWSVFFLSREQWPPRPQVVDGVFGPSSIYTHRHSHGVGFSRAIFLVGSRVVLSVASSASILPPGIAGKRPLLFVVPPVEHVRPDPGPLSRR